MEIEAGKAADFEERKGKFVKVGKLKIGVFLFDGKFYAVDNTCPHLGCPLSDGKVDDKYEGHYIVCPCHGWEFNVKDGKGPPGFDDNVKPYRAFEREGKVFVEIPEATAASEKEKGGALRGYLEEWKRGHDEHDPKFEHIQQRAITGESPVLPMSTLQKVPKFEEILFRGAQLAEFPLLEEEEVKLETVIGKNAKEPLVLSVPFFVSHMSFGALSVEAKTALALGASEVGTAIGSGEGGLLQAERDAAAKYIYEYSPAEFTQKMDNVANANAVEIKFGQGTKPGMGGHLTKEKITEEIAKVRGIDKNKDSIAPSRFINIKNAKDIEDLVEELRKTSRGKPIGIKISAGQVEEDIKIALKSGADFITIDGRGGGTGASDATIKDNYTVPTVFALAKSRQTLEKENSKVDLVITGGIRDSADIAKCIAMGATATALATASLIGIGCQQYRTCHTGDCPVGIATQNPELRKRLDIQQSRERLVNFFKATERELRLISQTNGKNDVHRLSHKDIFTLSMPMHKIAGIPLP